MSLYVGFYRTTSSYDEESMARARRGEPANEPKFVEMVRTLPGALPEGCRLLGSWGTQSPNHPNVMIVEADDTSGLVFISQYYRGYLEFEWVPAVLVGATQEERDRWAEGLALRSATT